TFLLKNIPFGNYTIIVSAIGFEDYNQPLKISTKEQTIQVAIQEEEAIFNQVVVTGTKTFQSRFSSPVIVQVLENEALDKIQACNMAEGLKFQSGLRVETDCQTCNYSQLRINGLAGAYSQILINGRPIFSALNSLYGLEQIPNNMIDRIETVKGGGSALYGSNAIGGTVNILTKIPTKNSYQVDYTYQNINGQTNDHFVNANSTLLNKKKNFGASIFYTRRNRGLYDHNRDNFSELPELQNNSIGSNLLYRPKENQKIELSLTYLNEYRYGGEQVDTPAHFTQQSEERTHHTFMGSLDYQFNFNQENSSIIVYLANQYTKRDHYTGIFPDEEQEIQAHITNPPYGVSSTYTINTGTQFNHRVKNFLSGSNTFTMGVDVSVDDVFDEIKAYNYLIDQRSLLVGTFIQSNWKITPKLNFLSGLRMDKSNFVDKLIFNPRFSLMVKTKESSQLRFSWGQGFRAPQAFDADLHIAFAGGGISRVRLSDNLQEERSHSLTASYNFNKAYETFIFGFTLDAFYTSLNQAFFLQALGEDEFGQVFEKQNGAGAKVYGGNIDFRFNYNKVLQLEAGFTYQRSFFNESVQNIPNVDPQRAFLRTPNVYGYTIFNIMPNKKWYININTVHTGSMDIAHFAGAPNQEVDEIIKSRVFNELGYKAAYTFTLPKIKSKLELYGGIKNIFNSYQEDFDLGKNRDSNFIYGPATPRTFFVGLRIKS
ncbi:MAG: outer membrane receptor for ferrienterochelin and colicins, partial [Chitinophagales bacterium]